MCYLPALKYFEQVVETMFIVSTPERAVDLFHSLIRSKRDLIWGNAYNRSILQVEGVYVERPIGAELVPSEDDGGKPRQAWARYFQQW